jgi:methylenetetrahydrofolate dehydrogenase (NAD+)
MSGDATGKGLLLKADPIANVFREEIKRVLAERSRPPKLVGILSTSASPSKFYADFTKKQCDDLGVEFDLRLTGAALDPSSAEGEGVEEAIIEANEDDGVDGIMVCLNDILIIFTPANKGSLGVLSNFWCTAGLYYNCAISS